MISNRTLNRMWDFYNTVTAQDCAQLGQNQEKVQYTAPGRALKRKSSGKQPVEYNAVELLVDFKADMINGNFEDALHLYFQLRRLLNWEK